jgi:hypothetical protein
MAMATAQRKPCSKCEKGVGIFTCDGCQQSFCRKHADEHRQELATQMDVIGQEYDVIQRDINRETDEHPLLRRIDAWERETINKIHQVANQARTELNQLTSETKQELRTIMNILTNELQSSRESEDYTELDLKRWINQLNELRQDLEQSMNMYSIDNDGQRSVIRLIKVKKSQELRFPTSSIRTFGKNSHHNQNSISVNHERFDKRGQDITLSESGLVATNSGSNSGEVAFVSGVHSYSMGKHHIGFRIEKKTSEKFFFGIVTFSEMNPSSVIVSTATINGWILDKYSISNGARQEKLSNTGILEGDQVALTLDCDQTRIYLDHSRRTHALCLQIDEKKCPLPWKIVVGLDRIGSCVRIIG